MVGGESDENYSQGNPHLQVCHLHLGLTIFTPICGDGVTGMGGRESTEKWSQGHPHLKAHHLHSD